MPSQSVEYSNQLKSHYSKLIDSVAQEARPQNAKPAMPWREAGEIVGNALRIKKRLEGGG